MKISFIQKKIIIVNGNGRFTLSSNKKPSIYHIIELISKYICGGIQDTH